MSCEYAPPPRNPVRACSEWGSITLGAYWEYEMDEPAGLYERLKAERARTGHPDSTEYEVCVRRTVEQLICSGPEKGAGLVPGEIKSGKIRAFLGIMALGFDKGFDAAVILTKGSKAPGGQMYNRIVREYRTFAEENLVQIYDLLIMPQVSPDVLGRRKLIIIARKDHENMRRLLELFSERRADLLSRRVLIIDDDESELGALPFAKGQSGDAMLDTRLARDIETFRRMLRAPAFLHVVASASTLFFQPGADEDRARAYTPDEFRLLVTHELRVAQRYSRPFATARVIFANLGALSRQIGPQATEDVHHAALHAMIGVLRDSDFVGTLGANAAIAGFPETTATQVRDTVVGRLREAVHETTRVPMELVIDIAEGDEIAAMLAGD